MENTERAKLKPLPVTMASLMLRHPIYVRPEACVVFNGCSYSMPPQAIGQSGTLYFGIDTVRIVVGRWEATHPRLGVIAEGPWYPSTAQPSSKQSGARAQILTRSGSTSWTSERRRLSSSLNSSIAGRSNGRKTSNGFTIALYGDAVVLKALRAANAAGVYGAEYVAHQSVRLG